MADSEATNLALEIKGERWVSYPYGLAFPHSFAKAYPFRGRGIVSRLLYLLNKLYVDRLLLKRTKAPNLSDELMSSVAFFWPSSKRSMGRFYGYKITDGTVTEYLKLATTEEEKNSLRREAENARIAKSLSNKMFFVPGVVGMEESGGTLDVRYEPLPFDATACPVNDTWIGKVKVALRMISDAGYSHGDFAWHNFKASGEDLWIVDWEEMRKSENCLVDEICLECGLAYYWQHKPIDKVMEVFRSKYGCKASTRTMAKEAVDDLARRKVTMGDVLKKRLDAEGWR